MGLPEIPYIVDLPFSAVVDTLAFPYTIPYARAIEKEKQKSLSVSERIQMVEDI